MGYESSTMSEFQTLIYFPNECLLNYFSELSNDSSEKEISLFYQILKHQIFYKCLMNFGDNKITLVYKTNNLLIKLTIGLYSYSTTLSIKSNKAQNTKYTTMSVEI